MSGLSAARAGRALVESQMTSTVRYYTPGALVTDPVTGEVTQSETGAATCQARVRPMTLRDYPAEVGGEQVFASNYIVSVPYSQDPAPRVKQHVVVTDSPDSALVGAVMEIRGTAVGDQITARRLLCYKVGGS